MKTNKGITLVALVITIIVLLILAGVSISLVVGDNGVLTQSQAASKNTSISQVKEDFETVVAGQVTTFMGEWAKDTSETLLSDASADKYLNTDYLDAADIKTKMTTSPKGLTFDTPTATKPATVPANTTPTAVLIKFTLKSNNNEDVDGWLIVKDTTAKVSWDTSTTPTL